MTPGELSAALGKRAEAICRDLLPKGKKSGHSWVVGNVEGEKGDSMSVRLDGEHAGHWHDFATGEYGDLLDLWQAQRGCNLVEAMRQARSYLGMPDFDFKPKREYRRPERPKCAKVKPDSPVMEYLWGRGIDAATLGVYRVAEQGRDIVFPLLRDGELLNVKYLSIDRDENGKKKTRAEKDAEPCLFGWQAIPEQDRTVCITEGEIDALSLYQVGIPALSVPMGANNHKWIEIDFPWLERFDTIYLCYDQDESGRKAVPEVSERLGRHRCRVVTFGEHKDANDALKAGWTAEQFRNAIAAGFTFDPEELKNAADYLDDVISAFEEKGQARGMATPWPKVGDNLRFRDGELSIWAGVNGHGKSLILSQAIANGIAQGYRSCIASMEMQPAATLKRMVMQSAALANPSKEYITRVVQWLGGNGNGGGGLWLFGVTGTAKAERLLEVMLYARRRYEITQFVIDSLAKCGFDEDDYNGQKGFVDKLGDFAKENHCHIHLVLHARKGQNEYDPPGKMDVKGSGAITDMADNVMTVWRNKRKEDLISQAQSEGEEPTEEMLNRPDAALIVTKQRHHTWEKPIYLWFDPQTSLYLERPNQPLVRLVD